MKWLAIVAVVTLTPGITLAATNYTDWLREFRDPKGQNGSEEPLKPSTNSQSSESKGRQKPQPAEELDEQQRENLRKMRRGLRNGYKPKPIGTQPKVDYRTSPLHPSYQTPSRRPYEKHYRIRAFRKR